MELYITKKVESGDDFNIAPLDTLPHMHIITPQVIIRRDIGGNFYISDIPGGESSIVSHLIKLKKLICKQAFKKDPEDSEKYKLADDIVWVKNSPIMYYKCENTYVPCNRIILNYPVQLQISCKAINIYSVGKPYNSYNMVWTIDYVIVDKTFKWEVLSE